MEDPELWASYSAQVVALAALVGAMLGVLRQQGILTVDAQKTAFRLAEQYLPDTAHPAGSNLQTHIRIMAEVAAREASGFTRDSEKGPGEP